ncbi:PTS sugar transporter subunit IIA, partial [Lactobacillus sp. XV13L]|nr:PTS sugar transporter subunit IIA [Lactobacillus sp. XV13L]
CKREDEFPTGLETQYLPIALPHANPENVNKAFIAVVKTKKEIVMKQMGTDEEMSTRNFFFLGIVKEKQELQVKLLQRFMQLMNDKNFVDGFKRLDEPAKVYKYLVDRF